MHKAVSSLNCPHCKLINPPEAEVCDCGYNFISQRKNSSHDDFTESELQLGMGDYLGVLILGIFYVIIAKASFTPGRAKKVFVLWGYLLILKFTLVIGYSILKT